jgi:hypothetical protein
MDKWLCIMLNTHNHFVRMAGDEVNGGGGKRDVDKLPPEWAWERFTIVDTGNGKYAFHNPSNNRFLRMSKSTVDGKGGEERAVHDLPPEEWWRWERFVVVELTGVGLGEELTGSVAAFPSVPSTSILIVSIKP